MCNIIRFIKLSLCAALTFPAIGHANDATTEINEKAAMEKLNFLVGNWAGEGVSYNVDGTASNYFDEEFVRYDLDGKILLINARGSNDGVTNYQLHTVIHYDIISKNYIYSPYSGKLTRPFTCNLTDGNQFICYTKTQSFRLIFQRLPDGRWNEYGERKTKDGWQKTFETILSETQ